uniref:Nitroreductase family protein n=1 Tax=candidate division WOR-3 bacterium TaxID=2052148 RepID=A0A7C4YCE9_UNCW3
MDKRLEFIFKRRSIRKFKKDYDVKDEDIKAILEAGMAAPSGHNAKPWHFIVIKNKETLKKISEIHPHAKMMKDASLCFAICADPGISEVLWEQDCAAATENMLLAIANIGLGGVWIGVHPRIERKKPLMELLEIPSKYELFSLIAVGYPDEEKEPRTQYDEKRIHLEKW